MEKTTKRKITVLVAVLLCGVLIAGVIFMFFNRDSDTKAIKEITSFESLNLRLSGMRVTEEYDIISDGDKAEISYYHIKYGGQEETRELQKSAVCDTKEVIDILNYCKAGKWNGFHGKHPRGVLDGTMFSLTASVNGGERLYADGSENFPRNFNDFEHWLYDKLK